MGNSICVYMCAGEDGRLCYCASVCFMAGAGCHLVWGNESIAAIQTLHFYYWRESSNELERRTRGGDTRWCWRFYLCIYCFRRPLSHPICFPFILVLFRPHLQPPVRFCCIYTLNPMSYICPTRFFCCSKLISWTFMGHAETCVNKDLFDSNLIESCNILWG